MEINRRVYFGLFMVTLATLMYEILLTRIFSVTMWYHFAFMAVSIAMFGMTVGALVVYLFPSYFTVDRAQKHMALSALFFSITTILSFLVHLAVPFSFNINLDGIISIALTYTSISVPFIFSGICVCLALTKFPRHISKLYAADLIGAAMGCIIFKYTLDITDGPTAVFVVSLFTALGAVMFAWQTGMSRLRNISAAICIVLGLFIIFNTVNSINQSSLLRIKWVKGKERQKPIYEKWNSFSRLSVRPAPDTIYKYGWGMSSEYDLNKINVEQLYLDIDGSAGTFLTKFNDDFDSLEFLKYDIVNLAHFLKMNAKVAVIGVGGARDILTALAFDQDFVEGIEINDNIIRLITGKFSDYTGNLHLNPRVSLVKDEARSYITRQKTKYDIIQASLIDTWAASTAGAFTLTENSLYTVEAWKIFLDHLNDNGILSFSRWHNEDLPAETYRLTSLAVSSLMSIGIKNPREHIILVNTNRGANRMGIGTILVKKDPFSTNDIAIINDVIKRMNFKPLLTPTYSSDNALARIATGRDLKKFLSTSNYNIMPPTDNKPFFFYYLKLRNIFNPIWLEKNIDANIKAVFILGVLLVIVVLLTLLFIVLPLILVSDRKILKGSFPMLIYFALIGLGFILVEISQIQRLVIFLGHPTYSLTVVLVSILVSSGIGSYETNRIINTQMNKSIFKRLVILLGVLCVFGLITPYLISSFQGAVTPVRIAVAVTILMPLGFFMGMAFPMGLKLVSVNKGVLTPWFWGINGATSVCGSVLAVVIAITFGITASFWTGVVCYLITIPTFISAVKTN
jgi:hypothetical protein